MCPLFPVLRNVIIEIPAATIMNLWASLGQDLNALVLLLHHLHISSFVIRRCCSEILWDVVVGKKVNSSAAHKVGIKGVLPPIES